MLANPSLEFISRECLEADFHMNPKFQEKLEFIQVEDNTRIVTTQKIPAGTLIYSGEPILYYIKSSDNSSSISRILCVLTMMDRKDFNILDKMLENHYPYNEEDYFSYLNIRYPGYEDNVMFTKANAIDFKIGANNFRAKDNLLLLYNISSKFNHSCSPNCLQIIGGDELKMSVWSIRDIDIGEECTITYLHPVLHIENVEERRHALLETVYFNCMCTYCTQGICQKFNDIYNENMKCIKNVGFCSQCGKISIIFKCTRCKKVSYCGKKCQKLDWSKHKLICEK